MKVMWITITLLVTMAVSILLDVIDLDSENNRKASMTIRGLAIFICLLSFLDAISNK
jgi:Na+/proline symporter